LRDTGFLLLPLTTEFAACFGNPGVEVILADAPGVGMAKGTAGVVNIQNVYGSKGNDTITGNNAPNVIASYGGVDVLAGRGSNDTFYIYGEQYTGTTIDGGTETDTLQGACTGDRARRTWRRTVSNRRARPPGDSTRPRPPPSSASTAQGSPGPLRLGHGHRP
jgi:hypothetical protein